MKTIRFTILIALCIFGTSMMAQETFSKNDLIQFSGMVVSSDENGEIVPLPYTNIGVLGTSRGTSSGVDGFFSIVAFKGDTIRFTSIGYETVDYVIPDTLKNSLYYYVQIMTQDNYLLPEAVIFPWPDRDHFKIEFLAIDITDEMRRRADENMAEEVLSELRYTIPADGSEATSLVLREYANQAVYSGQIKPQNIFNPLAWKKFVEAWKRGDFKKNKKK